MDRGQEIHLISFQHGAVQITQRDNAVTGSTRDTGDGGDLIVILITICSSPLAVHLKLQPFETVSGDEIGNPCHSFRSEYGRCTVFQNLKPFDGYCRHKGIGVDKTDARSGLHPCLHLAPAIQQNQGGGQTQTAQIDIGGTRRDILCEHIGIVLRTGIDGQGLDDIPDIFRANLRKGRAGKDSGRGRQLLLGFSLDVGARDDNFLQRTVLWRYVFSGWCILNRRPYRAGHKLHYNKGKCQGSDEVRDPFHHAKPFSLYIIDRADALKHCPVIQACCRKGQPRTHSRYRA